MLPLDAKRTGLDLTAALTEHPTILTWVGNRSVSRYSAYCDQVGISMFLNLKLIHGETLRLNVTFASTLSSLCKMAYPIPVGPKLTHNTDQRLIFILLEPFLEGLRITVFFFFFLKCLKYIRFNLTIKNMVIFYIPKS